MIYDVKHTEKGWFVVMPEMVDLFGTDMIPLPYTSQATPGHVKQTITDTPLAKEGNTFNFVP